MKKSNLIQAAKNLNKVLFEADDPQKINVKEEEAGALKSEIRKTAVILEESDDIDQNTVDILTELMDPNDLKKPVVATLKKLGVWADAENDAENDDVDDDDVDDTTDDDVDDDAEPSLEDQIEAAKTTKDCIKIAKTDERFADLKGKTFKTMKAMKAAMVAALDDDPVDDPVDDAPPAKKEKKTAVKKEKKGPSAYGTAIQLMCKKPTMTMPALIKAVEKKGIDPVVSKGAINTGYNAVRKVYTLLKENGFIAE